MRWEGKGRRIRLSALLFPQPRFLPSHDPVTFVFHFPQKRPLGPLTAVSTTLLAVKAFPRLLPGRPCSNRVSVSVNRFKRPLR
jgi:hypothetical protein